MAMGHTAERRGMSRELEPRDAAVQIVFVGALDSCGYDFAGSQRTTAGDIDRAIDPRRVRLGAALRYGRTDFVDDDLLPRADLALQPARRNLLLPRHQRVPAFLLDRVGHGVAERVRRRTGDRLIFEATDAVDLGFFEPVEQIGEVGIGFAGKTDDEGGTQRQLRAFLAPLLDPRQRLVLRRRALHGFEDFRARMLERNIEIGQYFALRH